MSKPQESFVELCVQGNALLEEVDDFVDKWHESTTDQDIHEFLGMTKKEYAMWVSDPGSLAYIVTAHRQKTSVRRIVEELKNLPMAARAADKEQAERLMKWLERNYIKSS